MKKINFLHVLVSFSMSILSFNCYARKAITVKTNHPGVSCNISILDRVETANLIGSSIDASTVLDKILRTKNYSFALSSAFSDIQDFNENYIPIVVKIMNDTPYTICFEPAHYVPFFQKNILPFKQVLALSKAMHQESNKAVVSSVIGLTTLTLILLFTNTIYYFTRHELNPLCNHSKTLLPVVFNLFGFMMATLQILTYHKLVTIHKHFLDKYAALLKRFIKDPNKGEEKNPYLRCVPPHSSYKELMFLNKKLIQLDPEIEASADFADAINGKRDLAYFFLTKPAEEAQMVS